MLIDLLIITTGACAVIGLVHILIAVYLWLSRTQPLSSGKLVVTVSPSDQRVEAMLVQANSLVSFQQGLQDVGLEVHCQCNPNSENYRIAAFFCIDHNIPFVHLV